MKFNQRLWMLLIICFAASPASALADLFVSGASANSVIRFDGTSGANLGNFVDPGDGGLSDPQGIAFGPDGNLYVASNGSNNVLRFDGNTGDFIDVFATLSDMNFPAEINFRGDYLYVSDFSVGTSGRVSRFNATTGVFFDHIITGAIFPDGQEFDADGNIYVSNFGVSSVRLYDSDGNYIRDFISSNSGGLSGPLDNLFLPNGQFLVSSFNTGSIKRYSADGVYIDDPITGLVGGPQGLEIGPDGHLYAGDFGRGLINRYDIDTFESLGTFATTGGSSTTNNFTFRAVPEPNSFLVIALGFTNLLLVRRKK